MSPKKKATWYKPSKAGFSGWKGKLTGIYGGLLSYYACALRTLRPVCYLTQCVQSLYKVLFYLRKPKKFPQDDFQTWMIDKISWNWRGIKFNVTFYIFRTQCLLLQVPLAKSRLNLCKQKKHPLTLQYRVLGDTKDYILS